MVTQVPWTVIIIKCKYCPMPVEAPPVSLAQKKLLKQTLRGEVKTPQNGKRVFNKNNIHVIMVHLLGEGASYHLFCSLLWNYLLDDFI